MASGTYGVVNGLGARAPCWLTGSWRLCVPTAAPGGSMVRCGFLCCDARISAWRGGELCTSLVQETAAVAETRGPALSWALRCRHPMQRASIAHGASFVFLGGWRGAWCCSTALCNAGPLLLVVVFRYWSWFGYRRCTCPNFVHDHPRGAGCCCLSYAHSMPEVNDSFRASSHWHDLTGISATSSAAGRPATCIQVWCPGATCGAYDELTGQAGSGVRC